MSTAAMVSPIAHGRKSKVALNHAVEVMTPTRAAELLSLNVGNRNIRRAVVERYAKDMAAGRWNFDGSPIRISDEGVLIDGQHRLTAVIESGCTLTMLIIYDLPLDVRDSIDTGAVRRAADVLQFNGWSDSTAVAATARIVMARQAGYANIGSGHPSNVEVHQWVERNPRIAECGDIYRRAYRNVPGSPSVIAAAYYMCSDISFEHAEDFFVRRLIGLEGLTSTDPVRALLTRLGQVTGRDTWVIKGEQLRYVISAWNLDRAGRGTTKLMAPRGGWTRDNFPEPK